MNKRVLLLTIDHHFIRTPDGKVWVKGIHDKLFWGKYLVSFDQVLALVRIKDGSYDEVQNWILSSCEGVEFCGAPFFQGPLQYLRRYYSVNRKISEIVRRKEITCAVFRVPSTIGLSAFHKFKKSGKPCGLEVVANFKDRSYYSHGFIKAILYHRMSRQLKIACENADGVSYVTEAAIQRNYPPNPSAIVTHYSSIDLPHAFYSSAEERQFDRIPVNLIHVSTLTNSGKGHDTLLKALKILRTQNYKVTATILGGGAYKAYYEKMSDDLGVKEWVTFTGNIGDKQGIRKYLADSDIFVFPTHTEGLPRVLIEAMSCSLPCISTPVGGIPELLESSYLLDAKDADGFANKIVSLITDPQERRRQGERNYRKALEYEYEALSHRRKAYYDALAGLKKDL